MSRRDYENELVTAMQSMSPEEKKLVDDDKYTLPAVDPTLSIYEAQPTDIGVRRDYIIDYVPLAPVSQGSVVEFYIPSTNLYWLSLDKSWLTIKGKIVKSDGAKLTSADKVSCINALGMSMWRECDIMLQQKSMSSDIGPLYSYKCIFDLYAYTHNDYLSRGAQTFLFYPDTPGNVDSVVITQGPNLGLVSRHEFVTKDEFSMDAPLGHDLSLQNKLLPPGIEIKIKLTRHSNDFVLMSSSVTENYQLVLSECTLHVHGLELSPGMLTKQHELLSDHNALYHFRRSILRSFTLAKSTKTWSMAQPFGTHIPFDIIIALVPSSGFLGKYSKNPFYFDHCNVTNITFRAEGYQPVSIRPNFTLNQMSGMYRALYEPDMGQISPAGLLNMSDMKNGLALFRLKLGQSGYERAFRAKHGQTHLSIEMSAELKEAYTLIAYGRRHDGYSCDIFKNIYVGSDCF